MKNKIYIINSYTKYGPLIATFIIVIAGHSGSILFNTSNFLEGLINPKIIFPMLALMAIALVVGYTIGLIPVFITYLCFEKFYEHKLKNASALDALFYGACTGFIWTPCLLLAIFDLHILFFGFVFGCFVIVPTSAICGWLEWKNFHINNSLFTQKI